MMTPARILFLAEGQLGDLLLLTPALRAVKESFPSCSVAVLVVERRTPEASHSFSDLTASNSERQRNPLGTNRHVDELYVLNRRALRARRGMTRLQAERQIITFIRKKKFDTVICTFPEDRFAQWAFVSGARNRVGQRKQPLQWLLTHKLESGKSERGVLEYYCDLVRLLGVAVHSTQTEYQVPDDSVTWASAVLRDAGMESSDRVVVIHPGASGDYKIWPPERYARLIDELLAMKCIVLLVSGDADAAVVDGIKKACRARFTEVKTGNDVGKLAALLRRANLCISNDSGPRHLAIAVGTPSLALFRQHHDREWDVYAHGPRMAVLKGGEACPACPEGVCCDLIPEGERFGSHCIRQIEVEEVVKLAASMLRSK